MTRVLSGKAHILKVWKEHIYIYTVYYLYMYIKYMLHIHIDIHIHKHIYILIIHIRTIYTNNINIRPNGPNLQTYTETTRRQWNSTKSTAPLSLHLHEGWIKGWCSVWPSHPPRSPLKGDILTYPKIHHPKKGHKLAELPGPTSWTCLPLKTNGPKPKKEAGSSSNDDFFRGYLTHKIHGTGIFTYI